MLFWREINRENRQTAQFNSLQSIGHLALSIFKYNYKINDFCHKNKFEICAKKLNELCVKNNQFRQFFKKTKFFRNRSFQYLALCEKIWWKFIEFLAKNNETRAIFDHKLLKNKYEIENVYNKSLKSALNSLLGQ